MNSPQSSPSRRRPALTLARWGAALLLFGAGLPGLTPAARALPGGAGRHAGTASVLLPGRHPAPRARAHATTEPLVASVGLSQSIVRQGGSVTGTVTLASATPNGEYVYLSVNDNENVASYPYYVYVRAGGATGSFTLGANSTPRLSATDNVVVSATTYNGDLQTANLAILPTAPLLLVTSAAVSGDTVAGNLTLNRIVAQDTTFTLSVTGTQGMMTNAVSIPATITVPAGSNAASFTVTTNAVSVPTQVFISATSGRSLYSTVLTVLPTRLFSLGLDNDTIVGGEGSITGTVTLAPAVPTNGQPVTIALSVADLNGNPTAAATAPSTVTVPVSTVTTPSTSADFTITTSAVSSDASLNVTATYIDPTTGLPYQLPELDGSGNLILDGNNNPIYTDDSYSMVLLVEAVHPLSLTVNPTTVAAGTPSVGTITLDNPAPPGGVIISLTNSNTAAANVPSVVTVPAGSATATFTINPRNISAPDTATITALVGTETVSADLAINPVPLVSLTFTPSTLASGGASTGTVSISNNPTSGIVAPSGGLTVLLSFGAGSPSPNPITLPASVVIPAGAQSMTFPVTAAGVATGVMVPVVATLGPTTQMATLTVQAATIGGSGVGVTLAPSSVIGSQPSVGTVTLSGQAPAGGLAIGLAVTDAGGNATTLATVPATVTVPAGQTSVTFPITTDATPTSTSVIITASASGSTPQTTTLTIQTAGFQFIVAPASVVAGAVATGTVTLAAPAPADTTITLTGGTDVTLPALVIVKQGTTSARFTINTGNVASATTLMPTATLAGETLTQSLTITPNAGISYPAGLNMISLPYNYGAEPLATVFGFTPVPIYVYNPAYFNYNVPAAPTTVPPPGEGFWVRFPSATTVTQVGTPVDQTQGYVIRLPQGWNMIGDPFLTAAPVSGLTILYNSSSYLYAKAITSKVGLIGGLFSYTPGGGYNPITVGQSLAVGQGYWIYAAQPLTVVVPAPAGSGQPQAAKSGKTVRRP